MEKHNAIKKQLEFYFSDSNYKIDKFLKEQCTTNNGIPIQTLLQFKRLKQLKATEEDIRNISKELEIIEVVEDKIKKVETEEYKKYCEKDNIDECSVAILGFPLDYELDDVQKFLLQYMKPLLIRMRRNKNKEFTGNVIVELESEECAKKALEMEINAPISKNVIKDDKLEKVSDKTESDKTGENKNNDEKVDDSNLKVKEQKRKLENDETKKYKMEIKKLEIIKKMDFFERKKKKEPNYENNILFKPFKGKCYSYKCDENLNIKEIKETIQDIAFVDVQNKILRFKKLQNYEKKTIDGIEINKLGDKETIEYFKKLDIREKKYKNKK